MHCPSGLVGRAAGQAEVIHSPPTTYSLVTSSEQVVKKKFFIFRLKYRIFFLVP